MVQELNFQGYSDRVPPQNVDAEEAILGGILLDPEALGRVMELLHPEAFYISAHQEIYRAALALQAQGRPTDLMSVTTWLYDSGLLDKIGGQGRLAELVDRTISAVNIDQYAQLVTEKYLRRRLIQAGTAVAQLGYETTAPLERVLDQAEQKIFNVTQSRPGQGLTATSDILTQTFSDIEQRHLGLVTPGIPCGFYDLDAMTQGFQRSDLIIAAGRPSMGKTSFVLNIARNIAAFQKLPIAVFSLEMSKEQLVYRLLASEARIESGRLRAGRISPHEWEALGSGIDFLSRLPIFIDDTPNLAVTELRSKARRLQAENGGVLGMILIDYLQLMEGSGSDNRVQELSRITRSLKGLARELSAPVIALSQLSRGVESRTNKRPMMSDLRECVTGDTLVVLSSGQRVPIQELVGQTPEVVSFNSQGKLVLAQSDLVWKVGLKPVYKIRLASGRSIKATYNHRLYGFDGWQEVKDLVPGSRLATARYLPEPELAEEWTDLRVALLGQLIGDGSYLQGQPMRYYTASEENSNLVKMAAEQEFGAEVKQYKGRGKWHQLLISRNGNCWHPLGVKQWLHELGVFGQRSSEKRAPNAVFRLSNRQIALLLRHLWATDGCISIRQGRGSHRVFFSTISEGLAHDVAALLLRLGIQSTVRWCAGQCFSVDVQGCEQQLKFLEQVGAFGPQIQPALDLKLALKDVAANPNRDTLPKEVFGLVKAEMKTQGISHRQMAQLRGTAYAGSAHFKFAPSRSTLIDYASILDSDAIKELVETDIFWDEVIEIEFIGEQDVYDLTVPGTASWLADGIVSHNSGSIEQDADLIMMLYREEYYDPDTPDRGLAEVIIAKHRNGPVGTVKLLFDPQFTQFRNLATSG
ncbi:MAG: replicative DNA helicase [Elainellaceae cyanobacterium]